MGDVVNLRQVRKAKARATAADAAATARALHGRTKAAVRAERTERARTAKVVDGALIETVPRRDDGGAAAPSSRSPALSSEDEGI